MRRRMREGRAIGFLRTVVDGRLEGRCMRLQRCLGQGCTVAGPVRVLPRAQDQEQEMEKEGVVRVPGVEEVEREEERVGVG